MSSKKKKGCWLVLAPILLILVIISGISSCVNGDEETTVTSDTGIKSIVFSDTDAVELEVGRKDNGYVKVTYEKDFEENDIVFISSDESVATIELSSKGTSMVYYKITAVGAGSATVHAESADGVIKSETVTVTVNEEPTTKCTITSIEFNSSDALELAPDDTEYDYVRVVYDGAFDIESVIFVSSDENVVTVEKESKRNSLVYFTITAVGEGSATVHAETADGTVKSDIINVTVSEKETESDTTQKATVAATEKQNIEYVLNTGTKRIHYKSCSSVKTIKSKNYAETNDYDAAIAEGYKPCGNCKP